MVLYLLFFVTGPGVVVIALDPGDPDVMNRPPRDPKLPIANRGAIVSWVLYAVVLFVAALLPLVIGPDDPQADAPSVVDDHDLRRHGPGHGLQRARQPPRSGERARAAHPQGPRHLARPGALILLATELPGLQKGLLTESLTGRQWLACLGLAALLPLVIEGRKWLRRRPRRTEEVLDVRRAVAPSVRS